MNDKLLGWDIIKVCRQKVSALKREAWQFYEEEHF